MDVPGWRRTFRNRAYGPGAAFFLLGCGLGVGLLVLPLPQATGAQQILWRSLSLGGLLFLGAWLGVCVVKGLRERFVADEQGLTYRPGIGPPRHLTWEEIADFYVLQPGSGLPRFVVEGPAGTFTFGPAWNDAEALQTLIVQHATRSRARTWQRKDLREIRDWPQVFDYRHRFSPGHGWLVALFSLASAAFLLALGASLSFDRWAQEFGRLLAGWLVGLGLGGALGLPAAYFGLGWSVWRDVRRRAGERVEVDPAGLTFRNGETTVRLRWAEVSAFYVQKNPWLSVVEVHVVETASERIEFSRTIGQVDRLRALVEHFVGGPHFGPRACATPPGRRCSRPVP